MNIIEKIENGQYNFKQFTEEQTNFIKGLVKLAYNDGIDDGKAEIENKIWDAIEAETE